MTSNYGKVWRWDRCKYEWRGVTPQVNTCKNNRVTPNDDKRKKRSPLVHRLVAADFCEYPDDCDGIVNLRWATYTVNNRNTKQRHSKSGIRNIEILGNGRYKVSGCLNGRLRHIGIKHDLMAAIELRNEWLDFHGLERYC